VGVLERESKSFFKVFLRERMSKREPRKGVALS
jgi:hypothetical protein